MTRSYAEFVRTKLVRPEASGIEEPPQRFPHLFPFQIDLVRWALQRGRAAIFAGTGLGKTRIQLAWAKAVEAHTDHRVLILAPLAVAAQTVAEGEAIGIPVVQARKGSDAVGHPIAVTNYERLHHFDPSHFRAVVLDESSCIKHHDTKTLATLLEAFRATPFKLACTATPAPNDWTELGTHAEFLGVCSRAEMLAEFFTHDGGETSKWRLKRHARDAFWRFVASWGALVSHPRDLGYDQAGYDLPELVVREHIAEAAIPDGFLFAPEASSLTERRNARRESIDQRVGACAQTVLAEPNEAWIVWCELNAEGEALTRAIPGAIEISGSMSLAEKEHKLTAFGKGQFKVLVSKPSIAGFGLNWQHAARMAFVGVTDSFESYYQAVRRCWRFGQRRPVHVHIFASQAEGAVVSNLRRKEREAGELAQALAAETAAIVRSEVRGNARLSLDYNPTIPLEVPSWLATDA